MYYLTDNPRGGAANRVFRYGSSTDSVVIGDWNGDRKDTLGVRRGNVYYLTNTQGGVAQTVAKFGSPSDVVFTGDWNGDRKDTLGVRRGNTYYLSNAITGGVTNVTETFGSATDSFLVGDWNGDRIDTLAVRRSEGPARTFAGSGDFPVGSRVQPGLYRSASPANGCYWERVKDFSGSTGSIIANDFSAGMSPIYAQIKSTDAGFGTDSCATWVEARTSDPVRYLTVRDGQFRVGKDMASGRYQAPGGSDCYWERVSDFSGEGGSILANGFGDTGPIVDIPSTDVGFGTDGCGTWTRIGNAQPAKPSAKRQAIVNRPWTTATNPLVGHRSR